MAEERRAEDADGWAEVDMVEDVVGADVDAERVFAFDLFLNDF